MAEKELLASRTLGRLKLKLNEFCPGRENSADSFPVILLSPLAVTELGKDRKPIYLESRDPEMNLL
jgi:hypothetical protein